MGQQTEDNQKESYWYQAYQRDVSYWHKQCDEEKAKNDDLVWKARKIHDKLLLFWFFSFFECYILLDDARARNIFVGLVGAALLIYGAAWISKLEKIDKG